MKQEIKERNIRRNYGSMVQEKIRMKETRQKNEKRKKVEFKLSHHSCS